MTFETSVPRLYGRVVRSLLVRPAGFLLRALVSLAPFGAIVIIWQLSVEIVGLPVELYPPPGSVLAALVDIARNGILQSYTEISLVRWLIALGLGTVLTIPIALTFALFAPVRRAFMPSVSFFHSIAELAWLPILVLWFGFGDLPVVLTMMYVVFFPLLYNTMVGVESVPYATVAAVETLGASRLQITTNVLLPGALPFIVAGLRLGGSFAFRALIAAEIIAAQSGLGFMIFQARATQQLDRSVAGMIVIGIIWLVFDWGYLRPLENVTIERWGLVRGEGT